MGVWVCTQQKQYSTSVTMGGADPYADIDFEEINDLTNLATDEIKCLKVCFDLFDTKQQEFLSDDLGEIIEPWASDQLRRSLLTFSMKLMKMDPERLNSESSASFVQPSLLRILHWKK